MPSSLTALRDYWSSLVPHGTAFNVDDAILLVLSTCMRYENCLIKLALTDSDDRSMEALACSNLEQVKLLAEAREVTLDVYGRGSRSTVRLHD